MKRYIRTSTKKQFNGQQAAYMTKQFLEDLGFQRVEYKPKKGVPGTSGGSIILEFRYHEETRPEYAEEHNQYFDNFMLAQELYGPSTEDIHNKLGRSGTGHSKLYTGVLNDIENMFRENGLDVIVKYNARGSVDTWSTLIIYLFVPRT